MLMHAMLPLLHAVMHNGHKAVIKVWCMPIDKVHGTFGWKCEKSEHAAASNQFLVAQDRVVQECGLMDVTIKVCLYAYASVCCVDIAVQDWPHTYFASLPAGA